MKKVRVQVLDRTRPLLPMHLGQIEQRAHDYRRHGTTSLLVALDIAIGKIIRQQCQCHRDGAFRQILDHADANSPGA